MVADIWERTWTDNSQLTQTVAVVHIEDKWQDDDNDNKNYNDNTMTNTMTKTGDKDKDNVNVIMIIVEAANGELFNSYNCPYSRQNKCV